MRHHIMIALGLLLLVIFAIRAVNALAAPGLGLHEAYVAGGFALAIWLLWSGIRDFRRARATGEQAAPPPSQED